MTLIEVLLATLVLSIGLVGILGVIPVGYYDMVASGGQSEATGYAQQKMEDLRNQTFGTMASGNDTLQGTEFSRTWNVQQVAGTVAPNRLMRLTITVTWTGRGSRPQSVTIVSMRAE
jgi:Tfp pilus assembly protein PilV